VAISLAAFPDEEVDEAQAETTQPLTSDGIEPSSRKKQGCSRRK